MFIVIWKIDDIFKVRCYITEFCKETEDLIVEYDLFIPFILETARLLAALIRPNHLVRLSSWGLIHWPRRAIPMILGIHFILKRFENNLTSKQ